jgi:hypothetical protein
VIKLTTFGCFLSWAAYTPRPMFSVLPNRIFLNDIPPVFGTFS